MNNLVSRSLGLRPILCLGLVLAACGGGGGGGGSPTSPGAPLPPAGPPPDSSPISNDSLHGKVAGLFMPGTNFTGSIVRVVGVGEDEVRTDNSFRIAPVSPGEYRLSIVGPGHLNRQVWIEMQSGGANEIPALDLAEDDNFNLEAFDEIYREDGFAGTARMIERPRFFINQKDFDSLPNAAGPRLVASIEEAIHGPMADAIAPFFNRVTVTSKSKLPSYSGACDLPAGDINWYADRELKSADGTLLLGQAQWCWFPEENVIRGGMLWLDDNAGSGTILHEMVHLLGSAGHLTSTPSASVIGAPRTRTQFSLMDEQHLRFLYRRAPGVMSPDDARKLGVTDLTQLGGGGGMEVRCQLFPDGTVSIERSYPGGFAQ